MSRKNIFEKNLSALAERHPRLAGKLRDARGNSHCRLLEGKKGCPPNLLVESSGKRILFYDPEDPLHDCREYLEGMKIRYAPYVFFMGFGLGYHLEQFAARFSKEWGTKEIVIYEKEIEVFRLALHVGDYGTVLRHPHIHFFVGDDPEDTHVALSTDVLIRDRYALRSIKIIPLPPSVSLHDAYYHKAVRTIKKAASTVMVNVGNDSFDSLVGLEHTFSNIQHIFSNPGINSLYGKFRGKPGVLVAAGPSLKKNVHLLKGLEDRALIMSCDATLLPLMKKGIHPHLVTSLERSPEVLLHYANIHDFGNTYAVTLPIQTPESVEAFTGRKFIAYRKYSYFDWFEKDKGSLVVGHSVANLAFKILRHLACDPIILIGQDLAFAREGDSHIGGVVGRNRDNIFEYESVELEGNDGKPVKSMKYWEFFKLEYEEDIHSYNGTCVNATEGGAKIRGAKIMTFADAIDAYCRQPYNPQAILDETYHQFTIASDIQKEVDAMIVKADDTREIVERVIHEFETALEEARLVEEEVIRPSLDGAPCTEEGKERLLSVERKWLALGALFQGNKDLFAITAQTIQAYDLWLASELSFLKDIYANRAFLSMARVRKMTDWFAVMGSLLVFTRNVLGNAAITLKGEAQAVQ